MASKSCKDEKANSLHKSQHVGVTFSAKEREALEKIARHESVSLSTYIRNRILKVIKKDLEEAGLA